jgi:hypothetical protein
LFLIIYLFFEFFFEKSSIRREAALRIHRRESLRARLPQSKGLAPLDLFLGAAAAEIARQVIRRGLRLLFK